MNTAATGSCTTGPASSGAPRAVRHSVISLCDALNPGHLGPGAFDLLLPGDHNTIKGNTIKKQITLSPVYGAGGNGAQVDHGQYHTIEGNTGANDNASTEPSGGAATGYAYAGNTLTSPGAFLTPRGGGDRQNGPVHATSMTGNRVRDEVVSYGWQPANAALLTLRNTTITVPGGTAAWTDGGFVNGGRNVVTGTVVTHRG